LLVPLEKKAQRLADDLKENNTADYLLKRAFNLIEEVKQDIKEWNMHQAELMIPNILI